MYLVMHINLVSDFCNLSAILGNKLDTHNKHSHPQEQSNSSMNNNEQVHIKYWISDTLLSQK